MRGIHAVPRHTARRSDARVRTAPQINPHLNRPPTIDAMEYFLKALFLRRYVTYCARRQRYAQMEGAARLLSEFEGSAGALATPREPRRPFLNLSPSSTASGRRASAPSISGN